LEGAKKWVTPAISPQKRTGEVPIRPLAKDFYDIMKMFALVD